MIDTAKAANLWAGLLVALVYKTHLALGSPFTRMLT